MSNESILRRVRFSPTRFIAALPPRQFLRDLIASKLWGDKTLYGRDMNAMRFRAKYVSASENGDYYQVAFEDIDPAGDAADVDGPDSPYLLIQRQFEDPDRGDATLKRMTKHTSGIFAYVRLSSVDLASFLKLQAPPNGSSLLLATCRNLTGA